jgi:hypothetical protein
MKISLLSFLFAIIFISGNCSRSNSGGDDPPDPPPPPEAVYDETGCLFTSANGLVMAGYQGWFAAQGDGADRDWYHFQNGSCGGFLPGCSSIDFWPDMSEYTKTYPSPFQFSNGSNAPLYSPFDEESVDLHFKWMKDYGIDGVYLQRFVKEIDNHNPKGKAHFNKVLANALKAAKKYERSICIMYDLSGCNSTDVAYLEQDWNELQSLFSLFDNKTHPTYLRHNKKPLVAIWGVGFNDSRQYSIGDVELLIEKIKGPTKKVSVLLGVPYYWRALKNDAEATTRLHDVIRKADIVLPWAVGRYNNDSYNNTAGAELAGDIQWCNTNKVDYLPVVFPGFSWGNLKNDPSQYNAIPRLKGGFLWKQVAGAKISGAKSLYVAMFDELDEGTAIYKCARQNELPLHGSKQFVGVENDIGSDYYLWLTGEAAKWIHGAPGYGTVKPAR